MVPTIVSSVAVTCTGADTVELHENVNDYSENPADMMNTFTAGFTLPDHKLSLKISFLVMPFHDTDPFRGHANSARYIIKAI